MLPVKVHLSLSEGNINVKSLQDDVFRALTSLGLHLDNNGLLLTSKNKANILKSQKENDFEATIKVSFLNVAKGSESI